MPARADVLRAGEAAPADGAAAAAPAQQAHDDVLDIDDVLGKRIISTRLRRNVTIREENAAAALEVMSRFAVDPRWLDLPAARRCRRRETSRRRPACSSTRREAFAYYREQGVARGRVRGEAHGLARRRGRLPRRGVARAPLRRRDGERAASCYTRTGRRFFNDAALEAALLDAVAPRDRRGRASGTSSPPTGSASTAS